ncbi:hypothetical protein MJI37_31200, partial [Salmonella enterica subsp. enterica serovar Cerro]|nr:hypothetical protein [Salmonella enterica subsp. enterica serovar Cerro]
NLAESLSDNDTAAWLSSSLSDEDYVSGRLSQVSGKPSDNLRENNIIYGSRRPYLSDNHPKSGIVIKPITELIINASVGIDLLNNN